MKIASDLFANTNYTQGRRDGWGGQEGQNTWGPDWLGGPKILVKRLVIGATVKRVGGP